MRDAPMPLVSNDWRQLQDDIWRLSDARRDLPSDASDRGRSVRSSARIEPCEFATNGSRSRTSKLSSDNEWSDGRSDGRRSSGRNRGRGRNSPRTEAQTGRHGRGHGTLVWREKVKDYGPSDSDGNSHLARVNGVAKLAPDAAVARDTWTALDSDAHTRVKQWLERQSQAPQSSRDLTGARIEALDQAGGECAAHDRVKSWLDSGGLVQSGIEECNGDVNGKPDERPVCAVAVKPSDGDAVDDSKTDAAAALQCEGGAGEVEGSLPAVDAQEEGAVTHHQVDPGAGCESFVEKSLVAIHLVIASITGADEHLDPVIDSPPLPSECNLPAVESSAVKNVHECVTCEPVNGAEPVSLEPISESELCIEASASALPAASEPISDVRTCAELLATSQSCMAAEPMVVTAEPIPENDQSALLRCESDGICAAEEHDCRGSLQPETQTLCPQQRDADQVANSSAGPEVAEQPLRSEPSRLTYAASITWQAPSVWRAETCHVDGVSDPSHADVVENGYHSPSHDSEGAGACSSGPERTIRKSPRRLYHVNDVASGPLCNAASSGDLADLRAHENGNTPGWRPRGVNCVMPKALATNGCSSPLWFSDGPDVSHDHARSMNGHRGVCLYHDDDVLSAARPSVSRDDCLTVSEVASSWGGGLSDAVIEAELEEAITCREDAVFASSGQCSPGRAPHLKAGCHMSQLHLGKAVFFQNHRSSSRSSEDVSIGPPHHHPDGAVEYDADYETDGMVSSDERASDVSGVLNHAQHRPCWLEQIYQAGLAGQDDDYDEPLVDWDDVDWTDAWRDRSQARVRDVDFVFPVVPETRQMLQMDVVARRAPYLLCARKFSYEPVWVQGVKIVPEYPVIDWNPRPEDLCSVHLYSLGSIRHHTRLSLGSGSFKNCPLLTGLGASVSLSESESESDILADEDAALGSSLFPGTRSGRDRTSEGDLRDLFLAGQQKACRAYLAGHSSEPDQEQHDVDDSAVADELTALSLHANRGEDENAEEEIVKLAGTYFNAPPPRTGLVAWGVQQMETAIGEGRWLNNMPF